MGCAGSDYHNAFITSFEITTNKEASCGKVLRGGRISITVLSGLISETMSIDKDVLSCREVNIFSEGMHIRVHDSILPNSRYRSYPHMSHISSLKSSSRTCKSRCPSTDDC